jgi:hypothetical protein
LDSHQFTHIPKTSRQVHAVCDEAYLGLQSPGVGYFRCCIWGAAERARSKIHLFDPAKWRCMLYEGLSELQHTPLLRNSWNRLMSKASCGAMWLLEGV